MAKILLVDDAASLIELFGRAITSELGHEVTVMNSVAEVSRFWEGSLKAQGRSAGKDTEKSAQRSGGSSLFDLAMVDLAFPGEQDTGLSALYEVHRHSPETALGILTQGDVWTAAVLRDAWELLPICAVLSKGAPLRTQLSQIDAVVRRKRVVVDPSMQVLLPSNPNPWRTPQNFARLVAHRGHAKLWKALLELEGAPSYHEVAAQSGLSVNTVKNYRTQLVGELKLHGLNDSGLREMSEFARRCRPFLVPFLHSR
jgi:DNA-binding NarL/FixJ family response regulator